MNSTSENSVTFRLGTRKSLLAKTQSETVRQRLEAAGAPCVLVEIVSSGDVDRKTPLYAIEPETPGLFTKQLESALLQNEIDLAVHSLKDLPTDQPKELRVAAVPERVSSGDTLLISPAAHDAEALLGLRSGAVVGTSSLRREAQLLSARSDVKVVPVRGNVPTRVEHVREGKVAATLLAAAGLDRLQLDLSGLIRVDLSEDLFVPAPGQGALAVETRVDVPDALARALAAIHDPKAELETRIERLVLKGLHGGCTLPLGVRCRAGQDKIQLKAFLGISRDRKDAPREWIEFHHFDIAEASEETLIQKTISHFKPMLERAERGG